MTDIYETGKIFITFPISFFSTLVFFVIIVLLFLFYIFSQPKKTLKVGENLKKEINYLKELEQLRNLKSSKDFLQQTSKIFRNYLENKGNYEGFTKMTLKDILEKDLVEKKYKIFLEKVYFKEYKEEKVSLEEREGLLIELKSFILEKYK